MVSNQMSIRLDVGGTVPKEGERTLGLWQLVNVSINKHLLLAREI